MFWLKFLNVCIKQHPFYLLRNSLQPVSVHVSLNDNEQLLTPPLSSMGGVTQDI